MTSVQSSFAHAIHIYTFPKSHEYLLKILISIHAVNHAGRTLSDRDEEGTQKAWSDTDTEDPDSVHCVVTLAICNMYAISLSLKSISLI